MNPLGWAIALVTCALAGLCVRFEAQDNMALVHADDIVVQNGSGQSVYTLHELAEMRTLIASMERTISDMNTTMVQ